MTKPTMWMWRLDDQNRGLPKMTHHGEADQRVCIHEGVDGGEVWGNAVSLSNAESPFPEEEAATCVGQVIKFIRSCDDGMARQSTDAVRKPYTAPAIEKSAPFEELKLNCGFGAECTGQIGTS